MDWLVRAAGSRALINQTDVRLGVTATDTGLVMRGHFRTRGEIEPIHMKRTTDPVGYVRTPPTATLIDERLPKEFTTKDLRRITGMSRQSTHRWLQRMITLRAVTKTGYGAYYRETGATRVPTAT